MKEGWCRWEDFFEQPLYEVDRERLNELPVEYPDRSSSYWRPSYTSCHVEGECELVCKLYADWIVINDRTMNYIA